MQAADFPRRPDDWQAPAWLNEQAIQEVRQFHASFPMYQKTPLRDLKHLAGLMGIRKFLVKDESYRFGLNAFKVLGGSYAIGNYLAKKLGIPLKDLPYERMISDEIHRQLGEITFITATDGNHGRGVAWTANQLKQHAVVYMPKGTSLERLENIRKEGAEASITDLNYDDAVRKAAQEAKEKGWVLVQDTSWDGYEDIPRWIIQGYGTMALEAYEQLPERPTHIFLQAGVGSMASAVSGFFANAYPGEEKPVIVIVEPDQADCIFRTAQAADGRLHSVTGDMPTMMAGLACGEPCRLGWDVLAGAADYALHCDDSIAAKGMRILGAPVGDDPRVISGESGAVTSGAAVSLLMNEQYEKLKEKLHLDCDSVILCFSTEGATDILNYRRVVWDGEHASL